MIAFEDYRTLNNNMDVATVPDWYKSERYEYCESAFTKFTGSNIRTFFATLLTLIIG